MLIKIIHCSTVGGGPVWDLAIFILVLGEDQYQKVGVGPVPYLYIFREDQLKKPPCSTVLFNFINNTIFKIYIRLER